MIMSSDVMPYGEDFAFTMHLFPSSWYAMQHGSIFLAKELQWKIGIT